MGVKASGDDRDEAIVVDDAGGDVDKDRNGLL